MYFRRTVVVFFGLAYLYAFADHSITDLKASVQNSIVAHCKSNVACFGQCRDAGVEKIELVTNLKTDETFLRGKIWANTCHTFEDRWNNPDNPRVFAVFGSLIENPGCGYHEVQFLLPLQCTRGVWAPDYYHISKDIHDPTPVSKVTYFPLKREVSSEISTPYRAASYLWYNLVWLVDSNARNLRLDVEDVFDLIPENLKVCSYGSDFI